MDGSLGEETKLSAVVQGVVRVEQKLRVRVERTRRTSLLRSFWDDPDLRESQMTLGMMGMIVVHLKRPKGPPVDRDFVLMTHEWKINPGSRRPDPKGWYEHPKGTVADRADESLLRADGINPDAKFP